VRDEINYSSSFAKTLRSLRLNNTKNRI